jgi:hypothetical protein
MDSPDNVRLERVALHHGAAYVAMVAEHLASIEGYPYNNYPLAQVDFAAFVQELNDEAQGIGLPDGIPPQRTYVLVRSMRKILRPNVSSDGMAASLHTMLRLTIAA